MTVADLQARMSPSEFRDWVAYAQQEPLGEWREDLRHARLVKVLTELHGVKPPISFHQALPPWIDLPEPESTPEEFARAVGAL